MKFKSRSQQGQAIVLIAMAIVGLVGMTALAIDGGNAFSDRRHAQNAADSGVLSAALTSIRNNNDDTLMKAAGLAIASTNGYDSSNSIVEIHFCDDETIIFHGEPLICPNPFGLSTEYIHMVIESNIDTFFAPVVGVDQITNKVEAIAHVRPSVEMFFGHAMVSLSPTGRATYELNGGPSTAITGGGIFVNSDAVPCAFEVNGGSGTFTVPSITVVGEACPPDAGGVTATTGTQLAIPDYSWLDEKINCAGATAYNEADDRSGSTITPHTSPLFFSNSFPPTGVDTLEAGIYCLDDTFRINSAVAVLDGVDVTFVMLSEGVTLNGGSIRLSAPSTGPTAGLLFYQPISNTSAASFTGNAELILTGTILLPGADVAIAGSLNTHLNGQVIGGEIALSGDAGSTVHYDNAQNMNDPYQIELAR